MDLIYLSGFHLRRKNGDTYEPFMMFRISDVFKTNLKFHPSSKVSVKNYDLKFVNEFSIDYKVDNLELL